MATVFRRQGALELHTPLLMPRSAVMLDKPGLVCVMDKDGSTVALPYDLTIPFARWVARRNLPFLRRWTFDKVYRQVRKGQ
jgi:translation initiation factor 2-alpha kinase 4